jgi:hypothetical protein
MAAALASFGSVIASSSSGTVNEVVGGHAFEGLMLLGDSA